MEDAEGVPSRGNVEDESLDSLTVDKNVNELANEIKRKKRRRRRRQKKGNPSVDETTERPSSDSTAGSSSDVVPEGNLKNDNSCAEEESEKCQDEAKNENNEEREVREGLMGDNDIYGFSLNDTANNTGTPQSKKSGFSVTGLCIESEGSHNTIVLRDYQLDGIEWLIAMRESNINPVLADESGLGKTIQAIGMIKYLTKSKVYGPFLIVTPLNMMTDWILQFSIAYPEIPTVMLYDMGKDIVSLKTEIKEKIRAINKVSPLVVVTTYGVLQADIKYFKEIPWKYMVLDDAEWVKSENSFLSRAMKGEFKLTPKLLLTPHEIDDKVSDLWGTIVFTHPASSKHVELLKYWENVCDSADTRKKKDIILDNKRRLVAEMRKAVNKYKLRRCLRDVNIELPTIQHGLLYAPLTKIQQELYERTIQLCTQGRNLCADKTISHGWSQLLEGNYSSIKDTVLKIHDEDLEFPYIIFMRYLDEVLKKIVNHPYLFHLSRIHDSKKIPIGEDLVRKSGKLLVLNEMVKRLWEDKRKTVIISSSMGMLSLLESYAKLRKYNYVRVDSSLDVHGRLKAAMKFNNDPEVFLMLSLWNFNRGYEINSLLSRTFIVFDSDCDYTYDIMAKDRLHSVGLRGHIFIYRIATAGTVDEIIVEGASNRDKARFDYAAASIEYLNHRYATRFNRAMIIGPDGKIPKITKEEEES